MENNKTTSKRVRLTGIHYLRGFAAIAVVVFHAGLVLGSSKYQGNSVIATLTSGLDSGVDLFFVISGFVISLPLFQSKQINARDFARSRFFRVYPLAILTTCIFMGMGFLIANKQHDNFIRVFLTSSLLLPSPDQSVPVVLWTLKQEVLFYLLFSICFFNKTAGLILISTWTISSFIFSPTHWLGEWFFHVKNIEFLIGIIASSLFCKKIYKPRTAPITLLLYSFTAIFLFTPFFHTSDRLETLILSFSGAIIIYFTACMEFKKYPFFYLLGTASYSIYLIHLFFISAINKILIRISIPDILSFIILCIMGVFGGLVYYWLAERSIERYRNRTKPGITPPYCCK